MKTAVWALAALLAVHAVAGQATFKYCADAPAIYVATAASAVPYVRLFSRQFKNFDALPVVRSSGSDVALGLLLQGGANVAISTRPLLPVDYKSAGCPEGGVAQGKASAPCNGVTPAQVPIANDAVAAVVSTQYSSWAGTATQAQLLDLFSGTKKWGDVFPSAPSNIKDKLPEIAFPDPLSGTYNTVVNKLGLTAPSGSSVTFYANEDSLLAALVGNPNAIGFVSTARLSGGEDSSAVKPVTLDGVNPLQATPDYPLYRTVFAYVDPQNDLGVRVVCSLLSEAGQTVVKDGGGFPLTDVTASQTAAGCGSLSTYSGPSYEGGSEQFLFCKDAWRVVAVASAGGDIAATAGQYNRDPFTAVLVANVSNDNVALQAFLSGTADVAVVGRLLTGADYTRYACPENGVDTTSGNAITPCNGVVPKNVVLASSGGSNVFAYYNSVPRFQDRVNLNYVCDLINPAFGGVIASASGATPFDQVAQVLQRNRLVCAFDMPSNKPAASQV